MGYVIALGVGLVIGLSLMIWALVERGKRHDAELELQTARDTTLAYKRELKSAQAEFYAGALRLAATEDQVKVLQQALSNLRQYLAKSKDPIIVEEMLKDAIGKSRS